MSTTEQLQFCSIGTLMNDENECHKLWKQKELIPFSSLAEEEQQKLLSRTNLADKVNEIQTVCAHHKALKIDHYGGLRNVCCDPFKTHRKIIRKTLHVISVPFAKKLKENDIQVIPGKKICRPCRKRLTDLCEASSSLLCDASSSEQGADSGAGASAAHLFERSSLKQHSVPQCDQSRYKQRKSSMNERVGKRVPVSLDVPTDDVALENYIGKLECGEKAQELEILMEKIRRKINDEETTYSEKIQFLTLAPESWSSKDIVEYFKVTDHMVRVAKSLVAEYGIFTKPPLRKGKTLTTEVKNVILNFYCDDENSRIMTGTHDKVYIAPNVYEQTRRILFNLKELYLSFKAKYPDVKVGFSTFVSIRPNWCVIGKSPGLSTHAMRVCMIHQNVILMLKAAQIEESYQELISMMVCDPNEEDCMLERCANCPGDETVLEYLEKKFDDTQDTIAFNQWIPTDEKVEMILQTLPVSDYLEFLVNKLTKLVPHAFIAKRQSNFLKHRKQSLDEETVVCLMNFSENYSFYVQDEAQGYHWTCISCTVHPVVCYYSVDGDLQRYSLCFLSNSLDPDVGMVYEIQKETVRFLKSKLKSIKKIEYFTESTTYYKNRKNLVNLCQHEEDFGVCAEWSFLATDHSVSACEEIGSAVKRSVTLESLRRPLTNQIINLEQMILHCKTSMRDIHFQEIEEQELEKSRVWLEQRMRLATNIKGIRSFHNFRPLSGSRIAAKRLNFEENCSYVFSIFDSVCRGKTSIVTIKEGGYVVVAYDKDWFIGYVADVDMDNGDVQVHILHPKGPALSFHFPKRKDIRWIPTGHIVCCIEPPTLATLWGQYQISSETSRKISGEWEAFLRQSYH